MEVPKAGSEVDHNSTLIGLVGDASYKRETQPYNSSDDSLQVLAARWAGKARSDFENKKQTYSTLDWIALFLPCVNWIKSYNVCLLLLRFFSCLMRSVFWLRTEDTEVLVC
jgi:hypothetical protein